MFVSFDMDEASPLRKQKADTPFVERKKAVYADLLDGLASIKLVVARHYDL